jgi:hypothetical protein
MRLWESFRDSDARERVLRQQVTIQQKQNSIMEMQVDNIQRQLKEAINKSKPDNTTAKQRIKSANPVQESKETKKSHNSINVENLLQELANKTALCEQLIQEKRDKDKQLKAPPRTNSLKAVASHSALTRRAKSPVPYAAAAEPIFEDKNSFKLFERIEILEAENKALRRKLFLNGIDLPAEAKKSLSRFSSQGYQDRKGTKFNESSRPRTAHSFASTLRPGSTASKFTTPLPDIHNTEGSRIRSAISNGSQLRVSFRDSEKITNGEDS